MDLFCLLGWEKYLRIHRWFSMHCSSARVKTILGPTWRGALVALRKESDSCYWSIFLSERRGGGGREGRGFLHMCITNIGGRIFQPTRVYRVTFTKAQVSGSMATGSEEGEGEGRMNRREERQKAGEKSTRARFLCHKVAVRTDFLPSTMHWQQRMLPVFPPLWVCLHVEVCRDVPVVAIQRGQFLSFLFSGVSPANVNT